jgi:hypothetical protein
MAARKPLVVVAGQVSELPVGDSIDAPVSQIEQVVLFLPQSTQWQEKIIPRTGTSPSQSVRAWLAGTVDTDENELWQLEGVSVLGLCGVDQVTFFLSCQFFEAGSIKISYQVQ